MARICDGRQIRAEVARAFDRAASARHGQPSPLYGVEDISTGGPMPHGLPTISLYTEAVGSSIRCVSDEGFAARLQGCAPYLSGFEFGRHGVVIAGRMVRALLRFSSAELAHRPIF